MLSLLFEAAVRATLIALAVALVLLAMRVRQMTLRHSLWTAVVMIMLVLPVWIAWGPRTALPLLGPEAWQSAMLTRTAAETTVLPESRAAHAAPPLMLPVSCAWTGDRTLWLCILRVWVCCSCAW